MNNAAKAFYIPQSDDREIISSCYGALETSAVVDDEQSDSGDSLFITQAPVPEAERSRRRSHNRRSQLSSIKLQEEGVDDKDSSSSSPRPSKTKHTRRKLKTFTLPKFHFSFLSNRRPSRAHLSVSQNTSLHYKAIGGFFLSVQEKQKNLRKKRDVTSLLSTLDAEGYHISPLSEDEEEGPECGDMKVVGRNCFIFASSKTKASQTSEKTDRSLNPKNRRKEQQTRPQPQASHKPRIRKPLKAFTVKHTVSSSDRDNAIVDETMTTTPLTRGEKKSNNGKEREEEQSDGSDWTYCDNLEERPIEKGIDGIETSSNVRVPRVKVDHMDKVSPEEQKEDKFESQSLPESPLEPVRGSNKQTVINEHNKWRKKTSIVNEGTVQDEVEPEAEAAAILSLGQDNHVQPVCAINNEKVCSENWETDRKQDDVTGVEGRSWSEVEFEHLDTLELETNCIPNMIDHVQEEPPTMLTNVELENLSCDEDWEKKKNGVEVGEDRNLEFKVRLEKDLPCALTCDVSKKKKSRKRCVEDDVQEKSNVTFKPTNDLPMTAKKCKKVGEGKIVNDEECGEENLLNVTSDLPLSFEELSEGTGDCAEYGQKFRATSEKKRKKHKKKLCELATEVEGDEGERDAEMIPSQVVITGERTFLDRGISPCETKRAEDCSDHKAAEFVMDQKAKRRRRNGMSEEISPHILDEKTVDDAKYSQKADGASDYRDAELVKTKKKKKRRERTFQDENEMDDDSDHSQKTKQVTDDEESMTEKKKKRRRNTVQDVDTAWAVDDSRETKDGENVLEKKKKQRRSRLSEGPDISQTFIENKTNVNPSQRFTDGCGDRGADSEKKKRKSMSEDVTISYTPHKNKKEGYDDESRTEKKTKEKGGDALFNRAVVPRDDFLSAQNRKKKRSISSLLVADGEQTDGQVLEELNKSAHDAECSQTEETVVLKKKKKKQRPKSDSETTATKVLVSHKKKVTDNHVKAHMRKKV